MLKRFCYLTFLLFLTMGMISSIFYYFIFLHGEFSVFNDREPEERQMLNILVVGADIDHNNISRSDTIFFVNIDLNDKGVGLISIPRDTRIVIPGRRSYEKMNAAYAHGGINLIRRTVEEFMQVEIDYHFDIDYQSFERIIDLLGGVELEIPFHMYYEDRAGGLLIDIPPGRQVLDGEKALHYVRYREPIEADIGRIQRQQYLMTAILRSIFDAGTLLKLPTLVKSIWDGIGTDMTYGDMVQFINLALSFDLNDIEMQMVPGVPDETDTYWLADKEALEVMVENLIYSKDYLANREIQLAIYNGNGMPGVASQVARTLELKGFTILHRGNARHHHYEETKILYPENEGEQVKRIQEYISGKALSLAELDDPHYQVDGAHFFIIIGHDYEGKG